MIYSSDRIELQHYLFIGVKFAVCSKKKYKHIEIY